MSNAQPPAGQFQVQPPHGERQPMGGAPGVPLSPGQAPPPLGSAPVPPVQPPWAQPVAASGPVIIRDAAGVDVTAQVLGGLQQNAPVAEIQRFFKTATLELLRALAVQHNLTLNEGTPPAAVPAVQPQGSPPAPSGEAASAPLAEGTRKRLSKKKDLPMIKQLLSEGATAEQISARIDLNLVSTKKAITELQAAAPPAAPVVTPPAAPSVAAPAAGEQSPTLTRVMQVASHVLSLAAGTGISFSEIASAAELLDNTRPEQA